MESSKRMADASPESDYRDAMFVKRGCCFWLPCLRKLDRIGTERDDEEEARDWNVLMKVTGMKWKMCVRRLRRNRFRHGGRRFRYDPLSYALNFDESAIERSSCCNEDLLRRDFSARYASMNCGSGKMSMDFHRGESS